MECGTGDEGGAGSGGIDGGGGGGGREVKKPVVKVCIGNVIRRLQLHDVSYDALLRELREAYPADAVVRVTYRDDEGDTITVDSEGELQEAFNVYYNGYAQIPHTQKPPLRLDIVVISGQRKEGSTVPQFSALPSNSHYLVTPSVPSLVAPALPTSAPPSLASTPRLSRVRESSVAPARMPRDSETGSDESEPESLVAGVQASLGTSHSATKPPGATQTVAKVPCPAIKPSGAAQPIAEVRHAATGALDGGSTGRLALGGLVFCGVARSSADDALLKVSGDGGSLESAIVSRSSDQLEVSRAVSFTQTAVKLSPFVSRVDCDTLIPNGPSVSHAPTFTVAPNPTMSDLADVATGVFSPLPTAPPSATSFAHTPPSLRPPPPTSTRTAPYLSPCLASANSRPSSHSPCLASANSRPSSHSPCLASANSRPSSHSPCLANANSRPSSHSPRPPPTPPPSLPPLSVSATTSSHPHASRPTILLRPPAPHAPMSPSKHVDGQEREPLARSLHAPDASARSPGDTPRPPTFFCDPSPLGGPQSERTSSSSLFSPSSSSLAPFPDMYVVARMEYDLDVLLRGFQRETGLCFVTVRREFDRIVELSRCHASLVASTEKGRRNPIGRGVDEDTGGGGGGDDDKDDGGDTDRETVRGDDDTLMARAPGRDIKEKNVAQAPKTRSRVIERDVSESVRRTTASASMLALSNLFPSDRLKKPTTVSRPPLATTVGPPSLAKVARSLPSERSVSTTNAVPKEAPKGVGLKSFDMSGAGGSFRASCSDGSVKTRASEGGAMGTARATVMSDGDFECMLQQTPKLRSCYRQLLAMGYAQYNCQHEIIKNRTHVNCLERCIDNLTL